MIFFCPVYHVATRIIFALRCFHTEIEIYIFTEKQIFFFSLRVLKYEQPGKQNPEDPADREQSVPPIKCRAPQRTGAQTPNTEFSQGNENHWLLLFFRVGNAYSHDLSQLIKLSPMRIELR